jgi:hypothetical protein
MIQKIKIAIKEYLRRYKRLFAFLKKAKKRWKYIKGVYGKQLIFYVQNGLRRVGLYPKDKVLASLKDKYKGQKIFVISTGPSLTMEDLDMIQKSGCITISMNTIIRIYDRTDWRPDYYVVDDYLGVYDLDDWWPEMEVYNLAKKCVLLSEPLKKYFTNLGDKSKVAFFPMNWLDHWYTSESKWFKYSRDWRYGIYDFYTVTSDAINLADYLGAKEIYLVGTDCNYAQQADHVGEKERNLTKEQLESYKGTGMIHTRAYEALARLIGDNVKVYNATRGGNLEVFPRVTLEEALGKE